MSPDTSFEDGVRLLFKSRISGMPVVNRQGKVIGIVSEKDFFRALHPSYQEYFESPISFANFEKLASNGIKKVRRMKVKNIMTADPQVGSPGTHILRIGALMLAKHIHRVPIAAQDKKLLGIVTRRDIYRAIFRKAFDL